MASCSLGAQGCRTSDGPPGRKPALSARAHGRLSEAPRAPAGLQPRKPENSATSGSSSRERLGRETEPPMIPCGGAHPSPSSVWTQGRRGPLQPHSVSLETVHQSSSPHTSPRHVKKEGRKCGGPSSPLPGLGACSTRSFPVGPEVPGGGGEGVLGGRGTDGPAPPASHGANARPPSPGSQRQCGVGGTGLSHLDGPTCPCLIHSVPVPGNARSRSENHPKPRHCPAEPAPPASGAQVPQGARAGPGGVRLPGPRAGRRWLWAAQESTRPTPPHSAGISCVLGFKS